MCFPVEEITSFLVGVWSVPLRLACPGFARQAQHMVAQASRPGVRAPRTPAPRWVTAQYFLRWVGEALVARAAWQARQPGPARYCYGQRSEPCWSQTVTVPQHPGYLRQQPEEVSWFLSINVERLYRMAQTPMEEIGGDLWVQAFLGVCQHLAQYYEALRRHYKARRAQEIVRQTLRRFVEWETGEASQALPPSLPLAGWETGGTPIPPGAANLGGATSERLPVAPPSLAAPGGAASGG